jgi:hypothetical protein
MSASRVNAGEKAMRVIHATDAVDCTLPKTTSAAHNICVSTQKASFGESPAPELRDVRIGTVHRLNELSQTRAAALDFKSRFEAQTLTRG